MDEQDATCGSRPGWAFWVLAALSTSIGWGIRGNFGHEAGAMLAGVLGGLAVVILSGREDWIRKTPWFAAFGALGWCFGGSMSYGQVIAYTHSGHSASVLYGFFSLFVIGFVWGALGLAGVALPAFLSRKQLAEFIGPLVTIFALVYLRDQYEIRIIAVDPAFRQNDPLYWFDTDWTAALLAFIGVFLYAGVRRRWDKACSLILHLTIGWWAAFLLLVVALDIWMTPPRGDNWAGCLGMTVGLWVFLARNRLGGALLASLVGGFIGGLGFSGAILLKLIEVTSGLETNWHSVMEQTYGAVNGLGIAAGMVLLVPRAPVLEKDAPRADWTEITAVSFVLLLVPYLNWLKNPEVWVEKKLIPASMYGLASTAWFDFGYAGFAAAVVWLLFRCRRVRIPLIPESPLGRAQLFYVTFLWLVVVMNFERALAGWSPQRLVTEGVIHLTAVVCTVLLLGTPVSARVPESVATFSHLIRRVAAIGAAGTVAAVLLQWGIVRAIYGNRFAGHAGYHVRFGPEATAITDKPKAGAPHP